MKSISYIFLLSLSVLLPVDSLFSMQAAQAGKGKTNAGRGANKKPRKPSAPSTPLTQSAENIIDAPAIVPEPVLQDVQVQETVVNDQDQLNPVPFDVQPLPVQIQENNNEEKPVVEVAQDIQLPAQESNNEVKPEVVEAAQALNVIDAPVAEVQPVQPEDRQPAIEVVPSLISPEPAVQEAAVTEDQIPEVYISEAVSELDVQQKEIINEELQKIRRYVLKKNNAQQEAVENSTVEAPKLSDSQRTQPLLYGYMQSFMNWKRGIGFNLLRELTSGKFDAHATNAHDMVHNGIAYFANINDAGNHIANIDNEIELLIKLYDRKFTIVEGSIEQALQFFKAVQQKQKDALTAKLDQRINAYNKAISDVLADMKKSNTVRPHELAKIVEDARVDVESDIKTSLQNINVTRMGARLCYILHPEYKFNINDTIAKTDCLKISNDNALLQKINFTDRMQEFELHTKQTLDRINTMKQTFLAIGTLK